MNIGRILDSCANPRLRLGFAYLSRILPTPLVFISGYVNTGIVLYCLKHLFRGLYVIELSCVHVEKKNKLIGSLRSTTRLQRRRPQNLHTNWQKQKFCISFKFSANLRRKMTISQVLQRTWTLRRKFEYSFLALTPHLLIQFLGSSASFQKLNKLT